ncbi:GNAT family N-acetyltransferase [Streptomyces aidingensis]|uniref:Ribosomal protein S18 acetylase RimI n=1 Tax=Streptomyces aidingensis TaxID=910347 RepID=A0A1I1H3D1_9ACTN|nr:GNAT family N-acetyltransferase [Streptomyces aidingensis]SFC18434.1 Ribosomal protein S18 acetylase RimI [Streptomyces aidingensis]
MTIRRAVPEDTEELLRLRRTMFTALGPIPAAPPDWEQACTKAFRDRLTTDPAFAAWVADTGTGRLLSCAIGTYAPRLPSPRSTAPHLGTVQAVVTDPAHRRKGHARACLTALLHWLTTQNCSHVELRASDQGAKLYTALGFSQSGDALMTWRPTPPSER